MSLPNAAPLIAPNTGTANDANPWANISNAINHGMQQRKQDFQDKQEQSYIQVQRKAQQDQLEQQAAQNKLNMLKPILLGDPKKAADPQYIQLMQQIHTKIGIPTPMNPDGSLALDEFKTPWASVDEKAKSSIMQMPQAQRKVALEGYSGVDKDAYTTDAFISSKDQASLQRAMTGVKSEDDRTRIQDARTQIAGDRAKAYETGNYARVGEIDATTAKVKAQTQMIFEQTKELPTKLDQAKQRLDDMKKRTNMIAARGGGGAIAATRMLNTEAQNALHLYNETDNQVKGLDVAYQNALANNADPDSPEMQSMHQQLTDAQQRRATLKTTYDDAQSYLTGEASGLAIGAHVSSTTGNNTKVIPSGGGKSLGRAPSGVTPGKYEMQGRQVEVRSDGNYYAI